LVLSTFTPFPVSADSVVTRRAVAVESSSDTGLSRVRRLRFARSSCQILRRFRSTSDTPRTNVFLTTMLAQAARLSSAITAPVVAAFAALGATRGQEEHGAMLDAKDERLPDREVRVEHIVLRHEPRPPRYTPRVYARSSTSAVPEW
jgi:hypothetical protein